MIETAGRKTFHIQGKLPSRIGCKVYLKPPQDVQKTGGAGFLGEIVDEVWATPELNDSPPRAASPNDWGDYSFCAQKIRSVEDGRETFHIRLAY
jgi:hypothetical protein